VVEKQEDSIIVKKNDNYLNISINCPIQFSLKDTLNNRKVLYVLFRLLKNENKAHLVTFQQISALFGLKSRQDSNNFHREFLHSEKDFLFYLERKRKLKAALPLIEKQVLKNPLLSMHEQYTKFMEANPTLEMSEVSFRNYYAEIDAVKLRKRYMQLISSEEKQSGKEITLDKERLLKEILEDEALSKRKRKAIVEEFPELMQTDKEAKKEVSFLQNFDKFGKNILVMFLVASGLNYQVLSFLLGISKTSVHNLFHSLSFIKRMIMSSIMWWSGEISTDEKWIRINGERRYILSIVDNKTGFPLDFQVVRNLKIETWKLFFSRFYQHYGIPRIVISDGSGAIANAIKQVFPSANHQLCKFHKLKNLRRKIYQSNCSHSKEKKMLKLANGIFRNQTYYGRKRAAQRLMEIAPQKVSLYVEKSILNKWNQLTKRYTSNSSERWNRKIDKAISGRYGLKSVAFVIQLITSLWLKECLMDRRHFEKCLIHEFNLKKICQESMQVSNIIEFFKDKLLNKVA